MTHLIHRYAGIVSFLCIATFFSSTVLAELFGSFEIIAKVKNLIVWPGLLILVPAMALTGGSGFSLSKSRKGRLIQQKQKKMRFIGANGILVLIPCALVLNHLAAMEAYDVFFYIVQGIELLSGAINLTLLSLNIRDGMKMKGRFRASLSAGR
ncbi:hypothetical protein [Zooshikella harenae]|uniref:Lipoprotein n=1 Tax=Zooshikella harenae TaxID=2827238 RepID=A0ABS5Z9J2_9GAMM|nr:hypothetical protein [Zooshikella harenae]MBU2710723.1 hypothetical protein [Zooshikella harenae]